MAWAASRVVSWWPVPNAIFGSIFIQCLAVFGGGSQMGETYHPRASRAGFIDSRHFAFQSWVSIFSIRRNFYLACFLILPLCGRFLHP